MGRSTLLVIAAALLTLAVGLVGWRMFSAPTVLRVAVGPSGSEDARLISVAGQQLVRDHAGLRFKVVPVEGEAEASQAMQDEQADLAVVRTDIAMPEKAQSVAVMHKDAAVLLTVPSRDIAAITALRGRTVGVVRRVPANARILELLLDHYEVPRDSVRIVTLESAGEVAGAFRSGAVDAVLAVGSISGRNVGDTVAAVTAAAGGAAPVFLPVNEAEAIAQRSAPFAAFEIVRGAFGGAVPRPAEAVKTISVSHRLVAASSLEDGTVSELTRLLFSMRPAVAAIVPLANRIEAPDTSRSSSLPVHPGAAAFYNDEVETFFDRYDDYIYIGAMLLSVVGSGLAGLLSSASVKRRARTLGLLDRLLGIVRLARAAGTAAELDALEHETDDILGVALGKAGRGGLDDAGVSAFSLGLEQARHAIADRRRSLPAAPAGPRIVAEAAE